MRSEAELESFYETPLKPLLQSLEQYRAENANKIKNRLFGALIYSPFIIIGILSLNAFILLLTSLPAVFFLGFAFQKYLSALEYLEHHFKEEILRKLLEFMFDDYEYIADQKINKSVLEKSMLFPYNIKTIRGDDFMRIRIGESSIMFCETTIGSSYNSKMFKGVFISATFNKDFSSKTFVFSKNLISIFQRIIKNLLFDFQKVKLEDVEFENEFQVLSSDQIEARYILTPALMQSILNYKHKADKKISFSFVDDRLYCAIPIREPLFEPPLFTAFDLDVIKDNFEPIKLFTDLVEDLHLNLRIWSKE